MKDKIKVFDWEEISWIYQEGENERYWAKAYIGTDPTKEEPAAEISYDSDKDDDYHCYFNYTFEDDKEYELSFSSLEEAKEYCDYILDQIGIKTLEDYYRTIA